VAANISNSQVFSDVRTELQSAFTDHKKEPFRYDDIHITMAYGPVIVANSEPELSEVLPDIDILEPTKHISDVVVGGVSLFLRKDKIIVKAEITSAGLTKLKEQLEQRYESIGTAVDKMRAEIDAEEKVMSERYPTLWTPRNPDKWAHITLLALKPDTDKAVIDEAVKHATDLLKGAASRVDCDYLYIVSKKSNRRVWLFDI
jgi:hypothetical protein